jgi:hypothetical protein
MEIESALAYELWTRLIHDEELYAAAMANDLDALLQRRHLEFSPQERAAMEQLRSQPGVRWSMENLRFRCAMQVAETVRNRLPRTTKLLTKGDRDWMQEIAFEYLAYYGWQPLGFNTIAEAQRFVDYVKVRIKKRRMAPPFLDEVLALEAALLEVLRKSSVIPSAAWPSSPASPIDDEVIAKARLKWAPCSSLIDSPVDLTDWLKSSDPAIGAVRPGSLHVLAWVPSLQAKHRIQILDDGARLLFARLQGKKSTAEVAAALGEELGVGCTEIYELVRGWWSGNALFQGAEAPDLAVEAGSAELARSGTIPQSDCLDQASSEPQLEQLQPKAAHRPGFCVVEVFDQSGAAWREALQGLAEKVPALAVKARKPAGAS